MSSFFEQMTEAPPDPILGISLRYNQDTRTTKVDLGAGIYKSADLKPYILRCVKQAEQQILEDETSKNYLPIDGLDRYIVQTKELVFGPLAQDRRIYGAQTTGATTALSVGGHLLKELGLGTIYLPSPTWPNHKRIFNYANLTTQTYPYYSQEKQGLDFTALIQAIEAMEEKSVLLLQACCHNPTGCDPTQQEWETLCAIIAKKRIFPFFDFAYQGFGEGLEKDAAPLRLFLDKNLEFAAAISHAKNFGIYAERCGALFVVCSEEKIAKRVASRVKVIARGFYSNPAVHGARIVATILQDAALKMQWQEELNSMLMRIQGMRKSLTEELQRLMGPSAFRFLFSQKGMFSYTGLSAEQVERLIAEYAIYLPSDGRINVAGLNDKNLSYVARSIAAVCNATNKIA